MHTQTQILLDQNGNRVSEYQDVIRDLVRARVPRSFVEIGVGVGHSLLAAHSAHSACSYLGVDLFDRRSSVNQLEECQANLREADAHIHLLKSSGDYPARSYGDRALDMVHIDLFDDSPAEHTIRFMVTAWLPRAKTIIVPNEPAYRTVLDGQKGLTLAEWNHIAEYTNGDLFNG